MADRAALAERVWYGRDRMSRVARAALRPAEQLYAGIAGARGILYDAGLLPTRPLPVPAISVGNLTVGGTGKTPIASWIAEQLRVRGASPALLLRGYGRDEIEVHRTLLPDVPVVVGADRVAAAGRAVAEGADILVLDDAYQHRRADRSLDLVLVSADRWPADGERGIRLLPAGTWREPLSAVRRADLVIVTRKAATDATVNAVHATLSRLAPLVPRVSVRLEPAELVAADGDARLPLGSLAGATVHALLTIADPRAFVAQLEARGARVTATVLPDHAEPTPGAIARFAGAVGEGELAVCTLKDAVKLRDHWPRPGPGLWYVSQRVVVERGVGGIERALEDVLRQRLPMTSSG